MIYTGPEGQDVLLCLNFIKISQKNFEISQFFKMAATTILDLVNSHILLADELWRAKMHHYAKFCQNLSNFFCDITIFFKMAAAAILDFRNFPILLTEERCIIVPNLVKVCQSAVEL